MFLYYLHELEDWAVWFGDRSSLVRQGDTRCVRDTTATHLANLTWSIAGRILYLNKFDEDKLIDCIGDWCEVGIVHGWGWKVGGVEICWGWFNCEKWITKCDWLLQTSAEASKTSLAGWSIYYELQTGPSGLDGFLDWTPDLIYIHILLDLRIWDRLLGHLSKRLLCIALCRPASAVVMLRFPRSEVCTQAWS